MLRFASLVLWCRFLDILITTASCIQQRIGMDKICMGLCLFCIWPDREKKTSLQFHVKFDLCKTELWRDLHTLNLITSLKTIYVQALQMWTCLNLFDSSFYEQLLYSCMTVLGLSLKKA